MKRTIFCVLSIKIIGRNAVSKGYSWASPARYNTIRLLLALALCVPLLACARTNGATQEEDVAHEKKNQVSEMTDYTTQGRYDDAIQLGLTLLKDNPRDEVIYQQIADVYLVRAQKEANNRDEWVGQAISYIQKSLSYHFDDKDPAGVHLFQDARAFELAGDLTSGNRCDYYAKAKQLLERRSSYLQGDNVTLGGKTFPLEPLRKENQKVLMGVLGKIESAKCDSKANSAGGGTR